MQRPISIVGAPSSIGIRPYDDGEMRHLHRVPRVLRELGIVERLKARDHGDVSSPPYRDFSRPPGRARNEAEVYEYNQRLADRVEESLRDGAFSLVLGGDCSIVLGSLLGARRAIGGGVGLAYVDAHADFAAPEESMTGSAASMALALAVGRGDTPLAKLDGERPLVEPQDVVLIGRRDQAEPSYGHSALAKLPIVDLPDEALRVRGLGQVATTALATLNASRPSGATRGFWIHIDADVINPDEIPAVDSPEPGGPTLNQLRALLTPLVRDPRALGIELTIYDPKLDPDRRCAARLVQFFEDLLVS